MDTAYDVLVYGPVFCDIIFTDLPSLPVLGTDIFAGDLTATVGGSAIVAAGLVMLIGAVERATLSRMGLER